MRLRLLLVIVLTLAMLGFGNREAEAGVAANFRGNGVWGISGSGLTDMAGVSVTITYNTAILGGKIVVTQGGGLPGGIFVANTTTTLGTIRIAWISTSPLTTDSGDLATISFSQHGSGNVGLTGLSSNFTTSGLNTQSQQSSINSGDQGGVGTSTTDIGTGTAGGGSGTAGGGTVSGGVTGGTVTLPSSPFGDESKPAQPPAATTPPPAEAAQQNATPPSSPAAEAPPAAEEKKPEALKPAKPQERKFVKVPSVLDGFRTLKGDESLAALTALFAPKQEVFRQEPPVVLSDGKATAKLAVKVPADATEAPNFAFRAAHFVSMSRGDDEWVIEVQPDENAVSAELLIIAGATEMELPIAVAPPVDLRKVMKKPEITETEFQLFRKERGTDKAPLYDLNGDGRRDYVDDYIFVANYLALPKTTKPEQKKEPAK